jgi:adenosylcobyric acid synthase
VEAKPGVVKGLGLLRMQTTFRKEKRTSQVRAKVASGGKGLLNGLSSVDVKGYEIHMGVSEVRETRPFRVKGNSRYDGYDDGGINGSGLVFGTYIHGLFKNAQFTRGLLANLRRISRPDAVETVPIDTGDRYDRLARLVRENLDMKRVNEIVFGRS